MADEAQPHDRVDTGSWILLAAATIASAWCAYQASLWNGEQMRAMSRAGVAQFSAARKMSVVNRDVTVDVGTYLGYVGADFRGETAHAAFLRTHARPDFKPALEAWIAKKASRPVDLPNPFTLPEYRLAEFDEMARLDAESRADIDQANAANQHSDGYVLHTVLFALSLFFLSGTSQLQRRGARHTMLVLGSVLVLLTLVSVSRLPRAHAGLFIRRFESFHSSGPSL
jgi:hypothetical protein